MLLLVAVAGVVWLKGCHDPGGPRRAASHEWVERALPPLLDRIQVEGTRTIGEHQTITVIRVPDPALLGTHVLDQHCLIYEHHIHRTSQMVCPGTAP